MRALIVLARWFGSFVVVATKLGAVMAFERVGEFVEKLHELSGRLIGQIGGQT
jgi:hypothetical protein